MGGSGRLTAGAAFERVVALRVISTARIRAHHKLMQAFPPEMFDSIVT